jgi:mannitol/fructose-specific phosphotransferase system IIA component (Ntr-type)
MNLADFTRPALLVSSLSGRDAAAIIRELSGVMAREGVIPDMETFCRAVLDRENLCGTDTEAGWALPHARVKGLNKPSFALGRTSTPVGWGAGGNRVQLIFLLAAPDPDDAGSYLGLIASLARLSKHIALPERLLTASNAIEMIESLHEASASAAGAIS